MAQSQMCKLAIAFADAKLASVRAANFAARQALEYFGAFEDDKTACNEAVEAIVTRYDRDFLMHQCGFSAKEVTEAHKAEAEGKTMDKLKKLTPTIAEMRNTNRETGKALAWNLNSSARIYVSMPAADQRLFSAWVTHGGTRQDTKKPFPPIGWDALRKTLSDYKSDGKLTDPKRRPNPAKKNKADAAKADAAKADAAKADAAKADAAKADAGKPEKLSDAEVFQRFSMATSFLVAQKYSNQKRIMRTVFEAFLRSVLKEGADAKEITAYETAMLYLGK